MVLVITVFTLLSQILGTLTYIRVYWSNTKIWCYGYQSPMFCGIIIYSYS